MNWLYCSLSPACCLRLLKSKKHSADCECAVCWQLSNCSKAPEHLFTLAMTLQIRAIYLKLQVCQKLTSNNTQLPFHAKNHFMIAYDAISKTLAWLLNKTSAIICKYFKPNIFRWNNSKKHQIFKMRNVIGHFKADTRMSVFENWGDWLV